MADFYPEMIKAEAVKAVEAYINNEVPLTDSISMIAKERGLNPEQIKRLIEATNQICYLKLQTITADRTFEFPLADYKQVMSKVLELDSGMAKQASERHRDSPLGIMTRSESMTKEASAKELSNADLVKQASAQEKAILVYRTIQRECHRLEKMASDSDIMVESLFKATNSAKQDEEFLDKLAHVADEQTFKALSKFAGMENEVGSGEQIFRRNDLVEVESLCGLYKEAQELVAAKSELYAKLEKAAEVLGNTMEKQAVASLALKAIGRAASKATAAATKAGGKAGFQTAKKVVSSPVAGAGAFGAIDYTTNPKNVSIKQRV